MTVLEAIEQLTAERKEKRIEPTDRKFVVDTPKNNVQRLDSFLFSLGGQLLDSFKDGHFSLLLK